MEGTISVNDVLKEEITEISNTLMPLGYHGELKHIRLVQDALSSWIKTLGELSAAAQGLKKVITTGQKLQNSTNSVFLLKDEHAKGGLGEVIGLLKFGRKRLYFCDERGKWVEVEPMCILDFYVRNEYQRHGHGRKLMDHMLQAKKVRVEHLAIDGPSEKMEQFLKKNYEIRLIRQNNNFAISQNFFDFDTAISVIQSGLTNLALTPGASRYGAPRPPSDIGMVIHGGSDFSSSNLDCSSRASSPAVTPELEAGQLSGCPRTPNSERPTTPIPQRPTTLQVGPPAGASEDSPPAAGTTTPRRESQLTDQGYFDLKFYHHKKW